MRKILILVFIALCISAKAQITFEHDYDSAATFASGSPAVESQLMIINFEISGERFVKINRWGKSIEIYNMNHALQKTIDCSGFPMAPGNEMGEVLYLSENLFSTDSKITFLYAFSQGISTNYTGIYKEDGTLLFSDTAAPLIRVNTPLQQYPIYNTTQGTKMILSYPNGHAKVFSLPGTLSTSIQEANNNLIAMQTQGRVSNAYPNPNNGSTKIDYTLPNGINEGEIVFYNLQGTEVKRFKVDRTFNTLLISTKEIAAGTYYYQLQSSGNSNEGNLPGKAGKMVVVK